MRGPYHKVRNTGQSKIRNLHYTRRTLHKGLVCLRINKHKISSKPDSTPLIVIQPIWFTDQMPTELNNIEWNASLGMTSKDIYQ